MAISVPISSTEKMSSRGKTPTKRKGKQPAPRKNKFDTNNPTTFKEAVAKCDLGEFKDGMFVMPGDEVKSIPEDMRAGLEDMSRGPLKIRDFKDGYFIERSVSEPVDVRKARKPSSTTPDQENLLPEEEFLLPPQHFLSTQAKSADPSLELGPRSVQDFILQHTVAAAPNVQSLPRPIPSAMLEPVRSSSSSSSLRSVSPPQHHSHYAAGSYSNSPHPSTLPAPSFNSGERLSPPFPSSGPSSSLPQPSPVMLHRPAVSMPIMPLVHGGVAPFPGPAPTNLPVPRGPSPPLPQNGGSGGDLHDMSFQLRRMLNISTSGTPVF